MNPNKLKKMIDTLRGNRSLREYEKYLAERYGNKIPTPSYSTLGMWVKGSSKQNSLSIHTVSLLVAETGKTYEEVFRDLEIPCVINTSDTGIVRLADRKSAQIIPSSFDSIISSLSESECFELGMKAFKRIYNKKNKKMNTLEIRCQILQLLSDYRITIEEFSCLCPGAAVDRQEIEAYLRGDNEIDIYTIEPSLIQGLGKILNRDITLEELKGLFASDCYCEGHQKQAVG